MSDRKASLLGLLETVAASCAEQFEEAVNAAYEAGASREDLLCTVEVGGALGQVPLGLLAQAYATRHARHWMAARCGTPRRAPAPKPA